VFIARGLWFIRKYQKARKNGYRGTKNVILEYLGGADGVRHVVGAELLGRMKPDGIGLI
jgi:hypothetical protein